MIDRQHLRQITRTAHFTLANTDSPYADPLPSASPSGGGPVPANKIRTIYYIKIQHNQAAKQLVELWRDGSTGTVVLDKLQVPGYGANAQIGKRYYILGSDLEQPVYTLLESQRLGVSIPVGTCWVTYGYYDEEA